MSNSKSSNKKIWTIVGISLVVVLTFWFANYFILVNNDNRGTYGDMYGAVNALFSGLAFAGIIFTIILQSNELKLQREELQETRKEFKTQNTTLRLQRFENTFFNMLSLHHDIVSGIDYDKEVFIPDDPESFTVLRRGHNKTKNFTGRDVFEDHYEALKKRMVKCLIVDDIDSEYMGLYWKFQNDFDHYFKNLYRIIKLVNTTQFTDGKDAEKEYWEKYKYTSIIRSQLSAYELLWLFYNCLSENGNEKFKPLIEKYALFKSFRFEELAKTEHKDFYKKGAYEKRV